MKLAIITGAAQGIGRRTAELLADAGYSLALLDLKPSASIPDADAQSYLGDISDEAHVIQTINSIHARWGRIDVLVNNAGISHIAPAETIPTDAFRRVLEINLVAPFLLARTAGAIMLEQRQGSIINIASIAGLTGIADRSAYNASKHGALGFTRTLREELRPRGMRVIAILPGATDTEIWNTLWKEAPRAKTIIKNRLAIQAHSGLLQNRQGQEDFGHAHIGHAMQKRLPVAIDAFENFLAGHAAIHSGRQPP